MGLGPCIVCGRNTNTRHHLIFGSSGRKLCDADSKRVPGLLVYLCDDCHTMGRYRLHDNPTAETLSKMLGQSLWEREYQSEYGTETRKKFIERYGKSYL